MAVVNFNIEQIDDPLIADGTPSFDGGMVSNNRANLLRPNESVALINCHVDKFGRIRTRRGILELGTPPPGHGSYVQGLINYRTKDNNYLVQASAGRLYAFTDPTWNQVALGGVLDNDVVHVIKYALINNPPNGYAVGQTTLIVDGIVGPVAVGEQFVITNNGISDLFFYTIVAHVETAGNTTSISIDPPGLVTAVNDNWQLAINRMGAINNPSGYPGGTTVIAIDGYVGAVSNGDPILIDGEGIKHVVSGHTESGGNTISITLSTPILGAFSGAAGTMFAMAAGNDQIFWCDTIGNVWGWDGSHTTNYERSTVWWKIIGAFLGKFPDTTPPSGVKTLVWFQSRLIAAGMNNEPDAVYFSGFLEPGSWDHDFQQVRVGGGESDPITALFGWTDLNLLVFKQNSVYVVNCDPSQNPDPTDPTLLVGSFAIKILTKNVGCPAPRSIVLIGGRSDEPGSDVFFLASDLTVRSVRRTVAAETQQQVGASISLEPEGGIQDVLNRINRDAIETCCAVYHDSEYLLAIPVDGATQPNYVLAFNVRTQTWSGVWVGWLPTMFSIRTSQASGIDLCFGQSDGTVQGWLDDVVESAEVPTTYQDNGVDIPTAILTRAYTLNDPFCPKTGMNTELEFQNSDATVNIQAILDMHSSSDPLAPAFSTMSSPLLLLPQILPFTLPLAHTLLWKSFDLERYGQWRELQFFIISTAGKLQMRSIRITGFMDTLVLQTT